MAPLHPVDTSAILRYVSSNFMTKRCLSNFFINLFVIFFLSLSHCVPFMLSS